MLKKIKNKSLIRKLLLFLIILFISLSVPFLRKPLLFIIKQPLKLVSLLQREFSGLLFYHRNYIENQKLKKQVGYLKYKQNSFNEIQRENERLKESLSFKKKSPFKVIAARVIARSMDSWSSIVIIDKGRNQGIGSGKACVTYLGLCGRVIEAGKNVAKVMLINDPNLSISAVCQRSRQEGLVSGTLGGSLIMRYLPRDADIEIGDTIVSSGLSENYPKGLLIGEVVEVGDEFSGLSRYAVIKPAVSLANIEELLVIVS